MTERIVRKWWKRFEVQGLAGLEDAPRPGAPSRYSAENKARVLEAALTRPSDLDLGFHCWTFERLAAYVHEHLGIHMKKTRIFEILHEEGLRWRHEETWFGERVDPDFAQKRGPSGRADDVIPSPNALHRWRWFSTPKMSYAEFASCSSSHFLSRSRWRFIPTECHRGEKNFLKLFSLSSPSIVQL